MARRDCRKEGHVLVEDDPLIECLACNKVLEVGDTVGRVVTSHRRHLGELVHPDDVAGAEWGTAGLDGAA